MRRPTFYLFKLKNRKRHPPSFIASIYAIITGIRNPKRKSAKRELWISPSNLLLSRLPKINRPSRNLSTQLMWSNRMRWTKMTFLWHHFHFSRWRLTRSLSETKLILEGHRCSLTSKIINRPINSCSNSELTLSCLCNNIPNAMRAGTGLLSICLLHRLVVQGQEATSISEKWTTRPSDEMPVIAPLFNNY